MSTYRDHFTVTGSGGAYDEGQYGAGSFWECVWTLEKTVLDHIAAEQRARSGTLAYLDFACGTGRVLAHLEGRCDTARGIDVSGEMLSRARKRVRLAELVCADVTASGGSVEGHYDLITAFRFVLNAEPALREAGLRALALRLKDGRSRLVVNTHGNPVSYKGIVVPFRRALHLRGADENLLSAAALARSLDEAGLEPESQFGMGVLPAPVLSRLPRNVALGLERTFSRIWGLRGLGVNQILVCRRKGT